jgi:hypothetical protein
MASAHNEKRPRPIGCDLFNRSMLCSGLALTGFKPRLRLVDYIDAALTAHNPAIAVTLLERTEGVTNFHGSILHCHGAAIAPWVALTASKTLANSWWTILGSNQ